MRELKARTRPGSRAITARKKNLSFLLPHVTVRIRYANTLLDHTDVVHFALDRASSTLQQIDCMNHEN